MGVADDDEEVKLLMTIPGIGYYMAVLMKSGDVCRFPFPEGVAVTLGLCLLHMLLVRQFGMLVSRRKAVAGLGGAIVEAAQTQFTSMTRR